MCAFFCGGAVFVRKRFCFSFDHAFGERGAFALKAPVFETGRKGGVGVQEDERPGIIVDIPETGAIGGLQARKGPACGGLDEGDDLHRRTVVREFPAMDAPCDAGVPRKDDASGGVAKVQFQEIDGCRRVVPRGLSHEPSDLGLESACGDLSNRHRIPF